MVLSPRINRRCDSSFNRPSREQAIGKPAAFHSKFVLPPSHGLLAAIKLN